MREIGKVAFKVSKTKKKSLPNPKGDSKDVKGRGSSYSGIRWNNLIDVIFFFG